MTPNTTPPMHLCLVRNASSFCSALPVFFLLIAITGCVLPPSYLEPEFLNKDELELVTEMRRGRDYAQSGRTDLAEKHFRRAVLLAPKEAVLYSDLGYILFSQNRLEEAKPLLEKALTLSPELLRARDIYARVLYKQGHFEETRDEYNRLLAYFYDYWGGEPGAENGPRFSKQDLVSAYRNLAAVYAVSGSADEAACYSHLAYAQEDPSYDIDYHARFLLMLGRPDLAAKALREYVAAKEGDVVDNVAFDYGVSLYLTGEKKLAEQAFIKISSESNSEAMMRTRSRLFRLLIIRTEGRTQEEHAIMEALLEEKDSFCDNPSSEELSYLPHEIVALLENTGKELCKSNGKLSS